jgi:nitroreductase
MDVDARTQVIPTILSRVTAGRLAQPAPSDADLQLILEAASRAPDHGRLKPWRFAIVRGNSLHAFGSLMADSLRKRNPNATELQLEREKQKPLRAPMIVVVGARIQQESRIPTIEQVLAVGAAAQNALLAAHALGYGCAWKTGDAAYDEDIKSEFGFRPQDSIIGFLYLGTRVAPPPFDRTTELSAHVWEWGGTI